MSSKREPDQDAVRAAREFLLGQSSASDRKSDRRGRPFRNDGRSRDREPRSLAMPPPARDLRARDVPGDVPADGTLGRLDLSAPDIRRTASGWRARCIHKRGVDSRHVNDARYGGYVGSFIEALEVRDRFYRDRGLPIPWKVQAVVDGERVAPEVVRDQRGVVVRWQEEEHLVTGNDADEIATEIALDLFVEFLEALQAQATNAPAPT